MTDPTDAGRPGGNAAAGAGEPPASQPASQAAPQTGTPQVPLTVLAQYVKDLSFENPRAPGIFANVGQPQSSATVAVQVNHLGERAYEVVLRMRVEGSANGEAIYLVELVYGGVFAVGNVAQEMVEPLLMVEAPRLLFPFARGVAAAATREGGFPQVLINPIDFAALYRNHRRQRAGQAAMADSAPAATPG